MISIWIKPTWGLSFLFKTMILIWIKPSWRLNLKFKLMINLKFKLMILIWIKPSWGFIYWNQQWFSQLYMALSVSPSLSLLCSLCSLSLCSLSVSLPFLRFFCPLLIPSPPSALRASSPSFSFCCAAFSPLSVCLPAGCDGGEAKKELAAATKEEQLRRRS